jgi:hypothetical protein
MSINDAYITQMRQRIAATAEGMLSGQCSYIDGARRINDMLDSARLDRLEEPFVAFVAITSETDAVPIGELRERWHADARTKLEPEWAKAEQYAKDVGEPACREVVAWITAHPSWVS